MKKIIIAVAALFLLAGCAQTVQELGKNIKYNVSSVSFAVKLDKNPGNLAKFFLSGGKENVNVAKANVKAVLEVTNKNPIPVAVAGADYTIFINEESVAAGQLKQDNLVIMPNKTEKIEINISVDIGNKLFMAIKKKKSKKGTRLDIKGNVNAGFQDLKIRIPFKETQYIQGAI